MHAHTYEYSGRRANSIAETIHYVILYCRYIETIYFLLKQSEVHQ